MHALVLRRRAVPLDPVPVELLDEIWRNVLAGLVQRHHLAPEPFGSTRDGWRNTDCQQALAWDFLQDEILRDARHGSSTPIEGPLLMHKAKKWVWRQHRRQDPLGARAFLAMGRAVRTLVAAGCPALALRHGLVRSAHWLRDVILPASPPGTKERIRPADLATLVDLGGWHRGVARAGTSSLRTWIERWLPTLPTLWPHATWPGCTVKEVFEVLLARVRADAVRTTSVEQDDGCIHLIDGVPPAKDGGWAGRALDAWLERRLLTPQLSLRPQAARGFYRALRRDILGRTNRPRHGRCTRLAVWMLGQARDRFASEIARLPHELTAAERHLAVLCAAADHLHVLLHEWPTESDLATAFYRPRIERGRFRPVQRVQQTEDRDTVRQALLHYLGNELR